MSPVIPLKAASFPEQLRKRYRPLRIKHIDAFTDVPLSGNPAGVVLDATGLTDQQMQTIAREMSLSETAFVLPPSSGDADLQIRWFTPQTEVNLCGHATIAAFHALAEESMHGMIADGSYHFRVQTKSGVLPGVVFKSCAGTKIMFGLTMPKFVRAGQYKLDMLRILNISLDEIDSRLPVVLSDNLYVPLRRLHTVFSVRPNFFAMSQFMTSRKISGLCVFTTETVDRTSAVHSRYFAPTVGINEDPVTGSANGPLGVYLVEHEQIQPTGETISIVGEQGDAIGRKGRVTIQLRLRGKEVTEVYIGGSAVTILDSTMLIP